MLNRCWCMSRHICGAHCSSPKSRCLHGSWQVQAQQLQTINNQNCNSLYYTRTSIVDSSNIPIHTGANDKDKLYSSSKWVTFCLLCRPNPWIVLFSQATNKSFPSVSTSRSPEINRQYVEKLWQRIFVRFWLLVSGFPFFLYAWQMFATSVLTWGWIRYSKVYWRVHWAQRAPVHWTTQIFKCG